jgi:hypothetical protein
MSSIDNIKAIMADGLELGTFVNNGDRIDLILDDGVEDTWLPYIFELALSRDKDMRPVLETWLKERVFPKNRFGSHRMLRELGLKKYDVQKIAEATRASLLTDPYWLVYDESDTYETKSVRGQMNEENRIFNKQGIRSKSKEPYPYNSMGIKEQDKERYTWRTAQITREL